jgi:prophage regulatory protein
MSDAKTPSPLGPTNSDLTEPLLLDVRTVARLLNVSVRTIHRLNATGEIPAPVRLGGRVLWHRDELRAWLEAGCPAREAWACVRAAQK